MHQYGTVISSVKSLVVASLLTTQQDLETSVALLPDPHSPLRCSRIATARIHLSTVGYFFFSVCRATASAAALIASGSPRKRLEVGFSALSNW
jgi:hypothetical protein